MVVVMVVVTMMMIEWMRVCKDCDLGGERRTSYGRAKTVSAKITVHTLFGRSAKETCLRFTLGAVARYSCSASNDKWASK